MPKVSVVIPFYNHGAYLLETLASVTDQSFVDYEIVIVDDGSTDPASRELLATLNQPQYQVIRTPNRGVSAARNCGIRNASGKYILPLDADDRIASTYMEKAVAILDARPEVAIVYCDQLLFGASERVLVLPDYDHRRLLAQNLLHASAMYRRTLWERVGGYSEEMRAGWEDWDFWIAASRYKDTVVKLSEPLFHYRVRTDSRDNVLRLAQKLSLFATMVGNHSDLYRRNAGYVLRVLFTHLLSGLTGRPESSR